jgi:hypothetical protein
MTWGARPNILPLDIVTGAQWKVILDEIERRGSPMWGNRQTSSSTTTTEVGVLRLDDCPVLAGRFYRINAGTLLLTATVANDVTRASLRITTDGSTPTTASTLIALAQDRVDNTSFPPTQALSVIFAPGSDQTLSVLLTAARVAGTGSSGIGGASTNPIELYIEDLGTSPGDTGTDI